MEIKERIKMIREINGLNQTEFADIFEKSLSTVQTWEQGRINPPTKVLKRIAKHFGISTDWLIEGTGEMKNTSNVQVATGNNNILNNSGSVSTAHQDPEISEICELLTRYASPEFRKNLRERLIKMKADSEI